MASSPQGAHSAAQETAQVHDEIKHRGASLQEDPGGKRGGGVEMGSKWPPGGFLRGERRFGWRGRVSKIAGTVQTKASRRSGNLGGWGEMGGTMKKELAHRRHSMAFLRREGRIGRGEGGRKEGVESCSRRQATHPMSPVTNSCRSTPAGEPHSPHPRLAHHCEAEA